MTELLAGLFDFSVEILGLAAIVFLRVGAAMMFLPGFGEQSVPLRIRLGIALAFTLVLFPAVQPLMPDQQAISAASYILTETVAGLLLGVLIRIMVHALQIAGTIAAQSTSLSQLFGGQAADPQPAMGHVLLIGGLALAMVLGLHVRLASYMLFSYELFPLGQLVSPAVLHDLGLRQVSRAFSLAFTLAAPFVIASLIYNVALGAINRAMPQLMVAFVGAPAITAGGLILLMIAAPFLLTIWMDAMNHFLADPLGGL
jgi:flagellar biosynthetic protein FliR